MIPFSRSVRTTNLKVTTGTILFDEATKVMNLCGSVCIC